ncbi:hypothetical protein V1506DRAFT_463222 [Lipomyces tetrasporus]
MLASMPQQQSASPATPTVPQSVPGSKHTCPHCSQSFTRHHNLKSHLLTHSHEKPFTCTTCNSKFRRLHDLKRHSKLHTGEKPYVCAKCGRKFARGDALARHGKGANGCAGRADGDNSDEDEDEDDDAAAAAAAAVASNNTPSHAPADGLLHPHQQHKRQALPSIRTQDGSGVPGTQQQKSIYAQANTYSPAVAESPRILSPLPHAYGGPPPPQAQQHQQPGPPGAHAPGGQVTGGPAGATQSPQSAALYSNFSGLMPQASGPTSAQNANAFLQNPQPYLQAQAVAAGHHHSSIEESLWTYVRGLEDRVRELEERLARSDNRLGFLEREMMAKR